MQFAWTKLRRACPKSNVGIAFDFRKKIWVISGQRILKFLKSVSNTVRDAGFTLSATKHVVRQTEKFSVRTEKSDAPNCQ